MSNSHESASNFMGRQIFHRKPTLEKIKSAFLGQRRIWSRIHLIPGHPVPHFLSPWTNDPHKIDPPGQTVPIKFGPHGQMVPQNLDPWTNGPCIS